MFVIPFNLMIVQRYTAMNTKVVRKSGDELIDVISESVGRMLRSKMDAVRCILQAAEIAAESYEAPKSFEGMSYVSGKFSNTLDEIVALPENLRNITYRYRLKIGIVNQMSEIRANLIF